MATKRIRNKSKNSTARKSRTKKAAAVQASKKGRTETIYRTPPGAQTAAVRGLSEAVLGVIKPRKSFKISDIQPRLPDLTRLQIYDVLWSLSKRAIIERVAVG